MRRQSEHPRIPAQSAKTAFRFAVSPRYRQSASARKALLLRPFHGGRPSYREQNGPLVTPCWLWLGATHPKGYACRWVEGRRVTVHRELVGPLAGNEDAHHLCGVRRCVNPAHIARVTKNDHARIHCGGRVALDAALELLAEYPRLTPAAIAGLSGHARKTVNAALRRAERSGRVRRVAPGEYVLTEATT